MGGGHVPHVPPSGSAPVMGPDSFDSAEREICARPTDFDCRLLQHVSHCERRSVLTSSA